MERLIYRSVAADGVGTRDVFAIVETSERRNPDRQITGFLLYDDDRFLQLIEGPRADIEELVGDLSKDPRHHSIEFIAASSAHDRLFADWEMKRLITFAGVPAMAEIRGVLMGKPEQEEIMRIVTEFVEGGGG